MQGFSDIFLYLFRFRYCSCCSGKIPLFIIGRNQHSHAAEAAIVSFQSKQTDVKRGSRSADTGFAAVFLIPIQFFNSDSVQMFNYIIDTASYHIFAQDLVDGPQIR